jgi:hypothetical protein
VSTLAGFCFDPPPYFQAESSSPSPEYARLLWNGLDPATRKGYKSAIKSYETLCAFNGDVAWPATETVLGKWITARAFGSSTLQNMGRIQPDTIQISQRCDPTIPIMPSTPTSSIAYISNALSKGLGMSSLPPQKELVTQSQ